MKILVANDDGIRSPGLEHLVRMARNLGEVWVVAPSGQCSAMSQRISVFGTLDLQPVPDYPVEGVRAWTVSGSPADCVKVALACVMTAVAVGASVAYGMHRCRADNVVEALRADAV